MSHDGAMATRVTRHELDAVMSAARVLVGVVAASAAEVDDQVTAPQLRILVLVATRPGTNLTAVAEALSVHPSNATRACDRLVRAGLLSRRDSTADRRHLSLSLTDDGRALLERVMSHRRSAFERVLARMSPDERGALAEAMHAFAVAADEPSDGGFWSS